MLVPGSLLVLAAEPLPCASRIWPMIFVMGAACEAQSLGGMDPQLLGIRDAVLPRCTCCHHQASNECEAYILRRAAPDRASTETLLRASRVWLTLL